MFFAFTAQQLSGELENSSSIGWSNVFGLQCSLQHIWSGKGASCRHKVLGRIEDKEGDEVA